ncbi:MAG: hypothetical protein ACREDK_09435, partial [Thermoplasmata archaeon]
MDRSRRHSPAPGGPFCGSTPIARAWPVLILLALLVGSLLVLPVSAAPSSSGTRTVSAAGAAVPSPVASTHGDLIVNATNSPYILSPATTGAGTYFQQGNITVASGGTLLVQSETIDFIQFIGSTGSAANRLSHIYTLEVQGVLQVDNSTITTNASVLNAYAKLDVNVSAGGQATFQQSALLFPGWLSVYGTGSHLAIESSNVSANPGVATVVENSTLQHDDLYGPTISVGGGGQAMLANSSLLQYFKDNTTAWGADSPTITSAAGQVASSTQSPTFSSWNLPADPENLSRASQYRTITGGNLTIVYSSAGASTASSSTFNFGGAFAMGTIGFGTGSGNVVTVELTPAIVSAINTQGVLALLAATGAYGGTSSLSYNVGTTNSATAVNISSVTITLDAARQYNVVVSGAGSVLTAVDSVLDVNWNLTPGTPVSLGTPVPYAWGSNKILLENGASAFLANVSVAGRSGTYWNQSIALPDASSHAYFYRWLDVPVVGAAQLAIPDAPTVAFYAGDSSQLNNHTSAQMNALATIDPDLGAYVNAQVVREGLAQYGATNPSGVAQLLLGTTELDQTNLPVGDFVGDYHVGVHLPGGANTTQWVYVATTPYPLGMSPATPDRSVAVAYTNYAPSLAIGQVSITIDNVSATSATHVLIGQSIAFDLQLVNAGLLPVASYGITMEFTPPGSSVPLLITAPSQGANVPGGGSTWSNFTWVVNETVVGRHGFGEHGLFGFSGQWSGAAGSVGGTGGAPGSIVGPLFTEVNVTIDPALIRLYAIAPSGQYILSNEYAANGSVTFLGSSTAIVNISGVASSGQSYLMASIRVASGPFTTAIVPDPSMTDGTYSLNVSASYNGRTVYYTVPNLFTVGTVTAPTTNWWQQTFLGLEILYWIIIAIAIVAAILGIVLVSSRKARGKLVE